MKGRTRRWVAFAEEPDEIVPPCCSVLPDNLIGDMWYSSEDFTQFRISTKALASGIQYRHSGTSEPASYTNTLSVTYESCCSRGSNKADRASLYYLARWFGVGPNRRGLEYLSSSKSIRVDRKARVSRSIAAVLDAQEEEYEDYESKAQHIRQLYEDIAAPALIFANRIATASELALCEDTKTLLLTARGGSKRPPEDIKQLHQLAILTAKGQAKGLPVPIGLPQQGSLKIEDALAPPLTTPGGGEASTAETGRLIQQGYPQQRLKIRHQQADLEGSPDRTQRRPFPAWW